MIIRSKAPLRIGLAGGGTDVSPYSDLYGGKVLNATINLYARVSIEPLNNGKIILNSVDMGEIQELESAAELELDGHLEILKGVYNRIVKDFVHKPLSFRLTTFVDVPKGSGLGSSSSYTVGLLNALYAYQNRFVSKSDLAKQACDIEIHRCGEPIGKQDQYAAAFGGLNLIRFHPDDSVSVDPVICKPEILQGLEDNTLVFFTGRTRSASAVLAQQSTSIQEKPNRRLVRRMVQLAFEMKSELESGCLEQVGEMLNENWRLKAQLTSGITDPQIDAWYGKALANGASGGKLLGAGNGGFLMFFAPPNRHDQITEALSELEKVKFRFDRSGTQVVFYHPA